MATAAEEEATEEKLPTAEGGTATPLYQGVGGGVQLGPRSEGGYEHIIIIIMK